MKSGSPDYLAMAREALRDYYARRAGLRPQGTLLPEPCRRCGGNLLRLDGGLWVCEQCFPETPAGPAPILDAELQQAAKVAAVDLLNRLAVRIIEAGPPERFWVGIWRETDSQELREALRVLGLDPFRIVYLDDPRVPEKYQQRRPQRPQLELFGEAAGASDTSRVLPGPASSG